MEKSLQSELIQNRPHSGSRRPNCGDVRLPRRGQLPDAARKGRRGRVDEEGFQAVPHHEGRPLPHHHHPRRPLGRQQLPQLEEGAEHPEETS